MATDPKVIRGEDTRKLIQARINAALSRKPTSSTLLSQALPFDQLLKATGTPSMGRVAPVVKQSIASIVQRKKRYSRPSTMKRLFASGMGYCLESTPLRLPAYQVLQVPTWFEVKNKPDVSVIIPLYNSVNEIACQIESWHSDGLVVEIIYVDDACPSHTKDSIVKLWAKNGCNPVGKIIANAENGGYGRACNIGAMHATADKLVFLNADTTVTSGWLTPLLKLLDDPEVGIVGNTQIKKGGEHHGTIDSMGSEWTWKDLTFSHIGRHIHQGSVLGRPMSPVDVPEDLKKNGEREMVTGCCFAIRTEVFAEIDGFDPRYQRGYWEDSEICCILRERGYKVMFTPESVIWHTQGHSAAGGDPRVHNNMIYFMNRWVNSGRIDKLIWSARPEPAKVNSIIVKRMGAHGDVIMATGVLPALKKKYPGASIDFLTAVPTVLNKNPYIRRVMNDPSQAEASYDLLINLDNSYEYHPGWHMRDAYADTAGVDPREIQPFVAAEQGSTNLTGRYAVIHSKRQIPHDWVGRSWMESGYEEIATRLKGEGYQVVVVGNHHDLGVTCDSDLRGQTNLNELSWVIKNAALFVGMDSMPMHLAMIHRVPGVAFFGCILPEKRLTGDSLVPVNAKKLECIGCHHVQIAPSHGTSICRRGDQACQADVTVDEMWTAILQSMTKTKKYCLQVIK